MEIQSYNTLHPALPLILSLWPCMSVRMSGWRQFLWACMHSATGPVSWVMKPKVKQVQGHVRKHADAPVIPAPSLNVASTLSDYADKLSSFIHLYSYSQIPAYVRERLLQVQSDSCPEWAVCYNLCYCSCLCLLPTAALLFEACWLTVSLWEYFLC